MAQELNHLKTIGRNLEKLAKTRPTTTQNFDPDWSAISETIENMTQSEKRIFLQARIESSRLDKMDRGKYDDLIGDYLLNEYPTLPSTNPFEDIVVDFAVDAEDRKDMIKVADMLKKGDKSAALKYAKELDNHRRLEHFGISLTPQQYILDLLGE